jgi:hypothetical protein
MTQMRKYTPNPLCSYDVCIILAGAHVHALYFERTIYSECVGLGRSTCHATLAQTYHFRILCHYQL